MPIIVIASVQLLLSQLHCSDFWIQIRKVFAAVSEPNYAVPWVYKPQDARTGTAFAVWWGNSISTWDLFTTFHIIKVLVASECWIFVGQIAGACYEIDHYSFKSSSQKLVLWPLKQWNTSFQFVKGMNNQNSFDKLATWGNRWLLTNAHVIRHAAVIQVRKRGDHQKFIAKVLCLGVDCDLAILFLGVPKFWTGDLQHIAVNPVKCFWRYRFRKCSQSFGVIATQDISNSDILKLETPTSTVNSAECFPAISSWGQWRIDHFGMPCLEFGWCWPSSFDRPCIQEFFFEASQNTCCKAHVALIADIFLL